jgi:microcystin-dependent protein
MRMLLSPGATPGKDVKTKADIDAQVTAAVQAALGGIAAVPTGVITPFAGTTAPPGWLLCAGQAVSRTTYSALFSVIGTTFGSGDGVNTFNVPDLRGRVVIGLDNLNGSSANRITAAAADQLGGSGGSETHTLSLSEMPSHDHTGSTSSSGSHTHTGTVGTGGSHTHTTDTSGAHTHTGTADVAGSHSHSGYTDSAGSHWHPIDANGFNTYVYGTQSITPGPYWGFWNDGTNVGGSVGARGSHSHSMQSAGAHTHNVTTNSSGDHTHSLTISSGGGHSHSIASSGSHSHSVSIDSGGAHTHTITAQGAGTAHNNVQPYMALGAIIKT